MNITIFLPVTRKENLNWLFQQLNDLDTRGVVANVLVGIDNPDITPDDVREAYKSIFPLTVFTTINGKLEKKNIKIRRDRIANVFNMAATLIPADSQLVFVIEDDTQIKPNALQNLLHAYRSLTEDKVLRNGKVVKGFKIGVVSGVQAGRWSVRMLGAWVADDPLDPKQLKTLPYTNELIYQHIDAAGFYCFITPAEAFKSTPFRAGAFGPDVFYGLDLRGKGYENVLDWTVPTGHVTENEVIMPDEKCTTIEFNLIDNIWKRKK